jgi:hypothetical protein
VREHQVEGAAAHAERRAARAAAFRPACDRVAGHQEIRDEPALLREDVDAIQVAIADVDQPVNGKVNAVQVG